MKLVLRLLKVFLKYYYFELTKPLKCAIISTLQKITMVHSKYNYSLSRGVAKVVSRQFRVLETVGSSPAASTTKESFEQ